MRALVTGANRGIGRQTALELARLGYEVVLACRSLEHGQAAADAVREETGARTHAVRFDAQQDDLSALVARVEALGGLDVLVNNAGAIFDGKVSEVEAVRRSLETNTLGPLKLTRALAPHLRDGARVVNVSSGMGAIGDMGSGHTGYRLSKAALNALTRILHHEMGRGIHVNAVCPGWVATDMGGAGAPRSLAEGAAGVVWAATLASDGPSGGFFRDGRAIDW